MGKLSTNLGTTEQGYKLDGTNKIEFHPIHVVQPGRANSPTEGNIDVRGVTFRANLWDINDYITIYGEIPHEFKDYNYLDFHIRAFPSTNASGTFTYQFEWSILHVDGTTSAGGVQTISGNISANDYANNIGQYEEYELPVPNTLVNGDMIICNVTRVSGAGNYPDNIAEIEIGGHCGVGQQGSTLS